MTKYTPEQVEDIMRSRVDWEEAFRLYLFGDGDFVNIHDDGELVVHGTGTHYRDPDAAGVIHGFSCPGAGNLDSDYFTEGFASWDEDLEAYVEIDGGRVIGSFDDVVEETVKNGEWGEWVEEQIAAAIRYHEEA